MTLIAGGISVKEEGISGKVVEKQKAEGLRGRGGLHGRRSRPTWPQGQTLVNRAITPIFQQSAVLTTPHPSRHGNGVPTFSSCISLFPCLCEENDNWNMRF